MDKLDTASLNHLIDLFPILPSWMGRFFYVDIIVDEDMFNYGYSDPSWVFSIDRYYEYTEFFDNTEREKND